MKPTVLVIEDHEFNRDLLVQLLEEEYTVLTAEDGETGLSLVMRERPTVVLLDLSLPVLDGWAVARRIREDDSLRDVRIVALTAHAMPGDEQKARDAGCDEYVAKPIDEDVLYEVLERYTEGARRSRGELG